MNFKNIMRENVPCWYELSWDSQKTALILRVHKDFADSIPLITEQAPIVSSFKKEFGFKSFDGNLSGGTAFGFDQSFNCKEIRNNFISFTIPIPVVKSLSKENCRNCGGSGKEKFYDEVCRSCKGSKKANEYDWNKVRAISATFSLFTMVAIFPEVKISCERMQLFTFTTITVSGQHGGSLGGEFSKILCEWLNSFKEDVSFPEVEKAMLAAHEQMLGLREFDRYCFRTRLSSGRFNMDCPGDACGIYPDGGLKGQGYKFACHNVDTPMQQITLLVGLAALHDLARKEIGP